MISPADGERNQRRQKATPSSPSTHPEDQITRLKGCTKVLGEVGGAKQRPGGVPTGERPGRLGAASLQHLCPLRAAGCQKCKESKNLPHEGDSEPQLGEGRWRVHVVDGENVGKEARGPRRGRFGRRLGPPGPSVWPQAAALLRSLLHSSD